MIEGLTPAKPTLESLKDRLLCAHKRMIRARMKVASAELEMKEALVGQEEAEQALDAWVAAHPEPQMEMFAA